jgi:Family of unknown function (DUF5681)
MTEYKVGYGKPPKPSRFKPGSSGNVKGRPKGSKNLKTLIRRAMTATISIREGSSSRRVSKIEGIVLRQIQSALKGDDRSAMAVIKMATQMGFLDDPDGNSAEATALSASDERILAELITRQKKPSGDECPEITGAHPHHAQYGWDEVSSRQTEPRSASQIL